MSREVIGPFKGEDRIYSNFYPAEVEHAGMIFPTVEHAYQAAKAIYLKDAKLIQGAKTPREARRLGRLVKVRPDWEHVKINIMAEIVEQKFRKHKNLRERLLATGSTEIVEINNWGDCFWGICKGKGRNMLGQILMEVRRRLKEEER